MVHKAHKVPKEHKARKVHKETLVESRLNMSSTPTPIKQTPALEN
jgi:hypothetical protein